MYSASTDKATVYNPTNHSYFNLNPSRASTILNHIVTINADKFTPVDAGLIPTGELRMVGGTPFEFTSPHEIGERISADDEQLFLGKGYDHNWVINGAAGTLRLAAKAVEKESGRVLETWTTQPGMQMYVGNFLDGTLKGKGGRVYGHRSAFCFETQHFPDSPNQPTFPSVVLRPGQAYRECTEYRFRVE